MSDKERLPCILEATDPWSHARALRLSTLHGTVETPIFMPVATQAALRHVDLNVAKDLDYQVLLANTYHLLLRLVVLDIKLVMFLELQRLEVLQLDKTQDSLLALLQELIN